VALIIGSFELLGLLAGQFGWTGGFWDWVGGIDLNMIGFVIVGLFALTWVAALLIWKYGRIEHTWNAPLAPRGAPD
jgi:high-affinity nickel-transport protein